MPCKNFHWDSFDACVSEMMQKQGYDKETAEKTCGKIKAETVEKAMTNEFPTLIKAGGQEWFSADLEWKEQGDERRIWGTATTPTMDQQKEIVLKAAVEGAVESFMLLPILHYWHTERPVGIIDKATFDGHEFQIEARIKPTKDCDDIWNAIKKGYLKKFSIYGRRLQGSPECKVEPDKRMNPCITKALYMDSISLCPDGYAVNPDSWLEIVKALTSDSNLIHTTVDGTPEEKKKRIERMAPEDETRPDSVTPPTEGGAPPGEIPGEPAVPAEEETLDIPSMLRDFGERLAKLEQIAGVTKGETIVKASDMLDQLGKLQTEVDQLKKAVVPRAPPIIVPSEMMKDGKVGAHTNLRLDQLIAGGTK